MPTLREVDTGPTGVDQVRANCEWGTDENKRPRVLQEASGKAQSQNWRHTRRTTTRKT